VTLCMFNLPVWMCMKRKFIMTSVLIQGPKQPDNDIDVYLRPFIAELLLLWKEPFMAWGEANGEGHIGRKSSLSSDTDLFHKAHLVVLQQSSLVTPYIVEHK
jgi:hypothetical protein